MRVLLSGIGSFPMRSALRKGAEGRCRELQDPEFHESVGGSAGKFVGVSSSF